MGLRKNLRKMYTPPPSRGYDYIIKLSVIGDAAVGKTSVTQRFVTGTFKEKYQATIGVDFLSKIVETKEKKVMLQIWDLAGQEQFGCVRQAYYNGTSACAIVFDLTKRKTFEHVRGWWREAYDNIGYRVPTILIGNKSDLQDIREVSKEEAEKMAHELSLDNITAGKGIVEYYQTSAKTDVRVVESFAGLAGEYLQCISRNKYSK